MDCLGGLGVLTISQKKSERPDLFSWLLADHQAIAKPTKQNTVDLYGDAHLIVVAGRQVKNIRLQPCHYHVVQNQGSVD